MAEGVRAPEPPPRPAAAQAQKAVHTNALPPLPPSRPLQIRIPAIQVDAPLVGLGLVPNGSLDVPPATDPWLAGWYEQGVTPGSTGTAVTIGHLDSATGPAVFYQLGALRRGDVIEVDREDGRTAVFTVDGVALYGADAFPDAQVYGNSDRPELRVITCGGAYSRSAGGYLANTVVYAQLSGVREATT
ncbi:class F sortase [Streptomyces sp. N35]|uniref:class F sortase n=1 Tax=Streptomyces sp. N35 TaxID=2795730 RepID=UPI0018F7CF51|nr:class F sortase [Streptomyces sp. N35]